MKNVIKKIAAMAMAFILLGTSTVISNNIQGSNSMVAQAGAGRIGYKWYDLIEIDGKKATVRYDRNSYMYAMPSDEYPITRMSGIERGGVYSYVAPNFNASPKRFYEKGESFLVNPKRIQYNVDSVWIMTTSGYYVPISVREISEMHQKLLEDAQDKRHLG